MTENGYTKRCESVSPWYDITLAARERGYLSLGLIENIIREIKTFRIRFRYGTNLRRSEVSLPFYFDTIDKWE